MGAILGAILGGLDILDGIQSDDPFLVADGIVSVVLAAATVISAETVAGAPVAVVISAVGLIWGGAQLLSGDVPVTKSIWDFYAGNIEMWEERIAVMGELVDNGGGPAMDVFMDKQREDPLYGLPVIR